MLTDSKALDESKAANLQKIGRRSKMIKLALGEEVEVRSDEDGFRGSWHAGRITASGLGFRKVRYHHLLDNYGMHHWVDRVPVRENLDREIDDNRRYTTCANSIRPLRQDTGFGQFGEFTLHYGMCVDALHNDAWWEGVVFDHADEAEKRSVFFPDLGDEMVFEIGDLRRAWDWDERTGEWSERGDWLFLRLIEKLEEECPLTVSVKQLWYDLQEKYCFNDAGKWKCPDEGLWREPMRETINDYFDMTVNDLFDSLGCLTDLDSEPELVEDTAEETDIKSSGSIVIAMPASGHRGVGQLEANDGRSYDESKFRQPVVGAWLPAENVLVSEPEFCPGAVDEYLRLRDRSRNTSLSGKLRKHLSYLGWKIEYRKEPSMTRFRYKAPDGKQYMSLIKICEAMSREAGGLVTLLEDEGSRPQDLSEKMLLELPQDGQNLKPNVTIPASSSDPVLEPECFPGGVENWFNCKNLKGPAQPQRVEMNSLNLKRNVTSPASSSDPVFEPEYFPEAVENWYKYKNLKGPVQGQRVEMNSLKVKQHLAFMGWSFCYAYKETKRELRYVSPKGKIFGSLRAACEACIRDGGTVGYDPSRDHTSENMAVLPCQTPQQLNTDLHHQPKVLAVYYPVAFDERQEAEKTKRVDKTLTVSSARRKKVKQVSTMPVRASKRVREAAAHNPSQSNPRTVLSWLIDTNAIPPRAEVQYLSRKDRRILKEGRVSREGISCSCCDKIYSLCGFEAHAGCSVRKPSANIYLRDGRSLMECQRQMLDKCNTAKKLDPKEKHEYPENDMLCSVCHYGGELMLCDRCPASFHVACLGLKEIPEGDWFCPSCRCVLCGRGELKKDISDDDVLRCCQCEHQYHLSCLRGRNGPNLDTDAQGNRFCSAECKRICSGLSRLLGQPFALGADNLAWTLVAAGKCGSSQTDEADMDMLTENHSKLNVALSVMHECFEPLKDPRTKRDIVEDIIFSRSSEHNRLNYRGFYTVILEQNEELITAATVRIFGDKVAEVPLVGTRLRHRRLGMCRRLMNELEKKLKGLGIERLVLPAVPSVLKTWTNSFGFSPMTESERLGFLSYNFLDFQGTTLCQKFLLHERTQDQASVAFPAPQQPPITHQPDKLHSSSRPESNSPGLGRKRACLDIINLNVYKRRKLQMPVQPS